MHTEQSDSPSECGQKSPDDFHHGGRSIFRYSTLARLNFQKAKEACDKNDQADDQQNLAEASGKCCHAHTRHREPNQECGEAASLFCGCCHELSFFSPRGAADFVK